MLLLSQVRHAWGVRGVDLEIEQGEAVAVVGSSGAGKSTLARILSGHLEPAEGSVRLRGEPYPPRWTDARRRASRDVQLVLQDASEALDPRMTVRQSLEEPLKIHGLDPTERLEAGLRDMGLDSRLLELRPSALSGGQKQRVHLLRALLLEPDVLVLDEPMVGLDVSVAARMTHVLVGWKKPRRVLVLVTHDLRSVSVIARRVVVMDEGRVVEDVSAEAFWSGPSSDAGRRLIDAAWSLAPAPSDVSP